jgi:cytochrome c553
MFRFPRFSQPLLIAAAGLTLSNAVFAADTTQKMSLDDRLKTCAACHGNDGNGVQQFPDYPKLAGQYSDYLQKALRDYRSEARKNPIMSAQAKQLHPSEIRALADYFARQKGQLVVVR